ncbi:hypothetical protein EON70_00020 [bacterium]|nr:MAG: hypothetical protein EON70_00020 [bacterium]
MLEQKLYFCSRTTVPYQKLRFWYGTFNDVITRLRFIIVGTIKTIFKLCFIVLKQSFFFRKPITKQR